MNSYINFIGLINQLKESSKHAIVNGEVSLLNDLKAYLHVTREVEHKLEEIISKSSSLNSAQLILVCGNVGDGKSHILSYLNEKISDVFQIHNDATESFNPDESFVGTLDKLLYKFKDTYEGVNDDKIILAINLGTLNNFLDEKGEEYGDLKKFVEEKGILGAEDVKDDDFNANSDYQYINFTDYQLYELNDGKAESEVINQLFEKIFSESKDNPIFPLYQEFKEQYSETLCPIIFNFDFLLEKENRGLVINLMIKAIVKSKGIVSMRSVLNFIYDIIIPPKFQVEAEQNFKRLVQKLAPEEYFRNILPNYLFEYPDLSNIFSIISQEDPCNRRSERIDDSVIRIINTNKIQDFAREKYVERLNKGRLFECLSKIQSKKVLISKTHIRLLYFNDSTKYRLSDTNYQEYITFLFHSNKGNRKEIRKLYNLVIQACERWNGNPNESQSTIIEIGKKQKKYRILQKFKPQPYLDNFKIREESLLRRFYPQLKLDFKSKEGEIITLHIDTGLFNLLNKVNQGYRPNKLDKNSYINFINFLNHLVEIDSQMERLKIDEVNIGKNIDYVFSTDAFGEYTFEKVK